MSEVLRWTYRQARRCLLGTGISTVFPFSVIKAAAVRHVRRLPRVQVQGSWMRRDPFDRLNLGLMGVYEPEETAFVQALLRPGETVLDLGANIGYYTLIFARAVGPAGRVFAFEPAPDTFAILKDNVDYNEAHQVVLENKAVADTDGTLNLYLAEGRPEDHRIFDDPDEARRAIPIGAVRLDTYAPLRDRAVDFVKMDIQGAEWQALCGMRELLARSPEVKILLEFWPYGIIRTGLDPVGMVRDLAGWGFEVREFGAGPALAPVRWDSLLERCGVTQDRYLNLLLARAPVMRRLDERWGAPAPGG